MRRLSRPVALKVAAVLSLLLGLWGIRFTLPYLTLGMAATNQRKEAPSFFEAVLFFVVSLVQIFAAFGAWQRKRWAILLTILTAGLVVLDALPGVLFAATTDLWFVATGTVSLGIIVIVLCLWREHHPGD